jgi:hypothetical protein
MSIARKPKPEATATINWLQQYPVGTVLLHDAARWTIRGWDFTGKYPIVLVSKGTGTKTVRKTSAWVVQSVKIS